MTIAARNNTPAARAGQRPQPAPVYSQDEQRERRRKHLPLRYGGEFDLTDEIAAICGPVAERVAADPRPSAYAADVAEVGDAVHELICVSAGLLAERAATRKVGHLPVDQRGRTKRLLCDLAPRPAPPVIDPAALADGGWSALLAAYAEPFAADLADLLAHAVPPGSTRGARSASERVENALRVLDHALLNLTKRLDRAERARAERSRPTPLTDTDKARAELAALGIDA